jgi:hypothetical protein
VSGGWIGVDLDGTLAKYAGWKGVDHIGEPIELMVNRVKGWLEAGKTVKIFTARVWNDGSPERAVEAKQAEEHIRAWCLKHIGQELEVTNAKDYEMTELWDDRAVQVVSNTGLRVNSSSISE